MRDNPAPAPSRALRKAAMCLLGLCPAWPLLASDEPRENYALPLHLDYLPAAFYTFRPEDMWLPPTRSWWLDASDWAMDQRDVQSRHVEDFGAWLDRALSGELVRDRNNESYLRLGFSTRWEKSNMPGLKPEARFRLDLPTVEEKWRLVIES
ncbi:MAG: hypothetical protein LPK85_08355, partial [Gammaproteobacteria bacterium]|nr:hypothetical protein [Gammaproteobacteria bacterium]